MRRSGADARLCPRRRRHGRGAGCPLCRDGREDRGTRDAQHAARRGGQDGSHHGHQLRSRRHGEPRLGLDAAAHVHPLGRAQRLQGARRRHAGGRRGGCQVGHAGVRGRLRLRLPQERERRPPDGAAVALQRQQQTANHLCIGVRLAGRGRHDRDQHQPGRHRVGHLPKQRAARTSTRWRRACGFATAPRIPTRANRSSF